VNARKDGQQKAQEENGADHGSGQRERERERERESERERDGRVPMGAAREDREKK
jgi:hypothetical protein